MAIKERRNKGKSLCGIAVNTYALQTYCHREFATVHKREALSTAASHQSKHTKQDRHPVTETARKADRHRALNPDRCTVLCSHKDANHKGAVEKIVRFTLPTSL